MTRTREVRWYIVASPEYGTVIPVLDYGQGPMEYGCDVLFVRARSAARARVLFVRAMRRNVRGKINRPEWLLDGSNPFRGVTTERITRESMTEMCADD